MNENLKRHSLLFDLGCKTTRDELSSSLILGSIINQVEFRHNNVFVNKFVSMRLDLSIYKIICLYVYMYIIYLYRFEIELFTYL
jgi:hypothetical protein